MNKSILSSGIFFGFVMGVLFSFMNGPVIGSISGIFAGILFGFLYHVFIKVFVKKVKKPQIEADKELVFEGRANHFKGIEGVGGWLFLTPGELLFKSHSMNIQNHQLVLPLNKIHDVKPAKTVGLFRNGLTLITEQKKPERFVVEDPDAWVEKIHQMMKREA